jgi:hypothetical protein
MLTCYVIAHTLWIAVVNDTPATINVDNITSIHPLLTYEETYTVIDSGFRNTVSVPLPYPDFIVQFNACLTEAQYQE